MTNIVSYSNFRLHLKDYLESVNNDSEPITIITKSGNNAVVMSADEWSSISETLYLLASPANKRKLNSSVKQFQNKQTKTFKSVSDLDKYVRG